MLSKFTAKIKLKNKIEGLDKCYIHYAHTLGWVQNLIHNIDDFDSFMQQGMKANFNDIQRWFGYADHFTYEFEFYKTFLLTKDYKYFPQAAEFIISGLAYDQGRLKEGDLNSKDLKYTAKILYDFFDDPNRFDSRVRETIDSQIKQAEDFSETSSKIIGILVARKKD